MTFGTSIYIKIWIYFVMGAPVIFMFTLLIKPLPQITMIALSLLCRLNET
jgi:hypothetical protein